MATTYKQMTNNILRRLRESTVSTVTQTAYSTMVGEFINDAKHIVENAWDWTALRTAVEVSASAGTYNYSLSGSSDRFKLFSAINTTQGEVMTYQPNTWMDRQQQLNATTPNSTPSHFTFRGVDSGGDLTVDVWPTPDQAYTLKFNGLIPQADLSDDADVLSIPHQPVQQLALAMLVRERGETGGTSAQEHFALADQFLSDAIAYDQALHPEESIWYVN